MDKKINVIPNQDQINAANAAADARMAKEGHYQVESPQGELNAEEQLRKQAEEEIMLRKRGEQVIRPDLADPSTKVLKGVGSQTTQTQYTAPVQNNVVRPKPIIETPKIETKVTPPPTHHKPINAPYDVIPLPSGGKIYPHKKSSLKVAYLNAMDEDMLTSPNMLQNGNFLEVLINNKVLDEEVTYDNLHIGDRNAIMIWLRATGYGEMYPIVVYDKDSNPIEVEVDLSTLKYKPLGAEPDAEGLITYVLPVSKKTVKFRMLGCKEVEDLEAALMMNLQSENLDYNHGITNRLEKMIVEIDGVRDENVIKEFIPYMRAGDSRALRNYYDEIESNIDLNITIEVPGGDPIHTFLPINVNFFWPDFRA